MKEKIVLLAILFFCFALVRNVDAVAYTWSGSGNWSTTTNWTPNGSPGAGDTVTFDGTSTNSCTIDAVVSVVSITVTSAYTGLITQNANVTVTGSSANFSIAGTNTWNANSKNLTILRNGGSSPTVITSGVYTNSVASFALRPWTATDSITLGNSISCDTFRVDDRYGTVNISSTIVASTKMQIATYYTSTIYVNEDVTVNCNGSTITTPELVLCGDTGRNYKGIVNAGTSTWNLGKISIEGDGGTFNYDTSAVLMIATNTLPASINNFYDLTISSGTTTLSSNLTVNRNFAILSGATLSPGSNTVSVAGTFNNAGTANLSSGFTYTGSSITNSGTLTLPNMTSYTGSITNSGSLTIPTLTLTGNITNNGTLNVTNLTITGNITNTGTINATNITVNGAVANTAGIITITGTSISFTGNITNTGTLTIPAGTVNGTITTSGNSTISNATLNGDVTNTGTLTLSSATVNQNITTSGNLTISASTINGDITNSSTLITNATTIPAGKTLLLNAGAIWNITTGNTATVNGTLRVSGTTLNKAVIQSSSTSGYCGLTINGSADLTGCKLYYLNTDGLKISSSGTITKIDNVDFKYGQTDGTHLQVLNGQTITITNVAFDDITNGTNITVKNNSKVQISGYTRGNNKDSIETGSSVDWEGATTKIDPKVGGKITSKDDLLTYIEVEANTQKKEMTFSITKVFKDELPNSSKTEGVVCAYDIEAVDNLNKDVKVLDGPVMIVLHANTDLTNILDSSGSNIGIKVDEASKRLSIGYWNGRYWTNVGGKVMVSTDKRDITISTKVSHLSKYAIITKETAGVITNASPNPFTPAASQWNTITFSFNNEENDNIEIKLWDITGVLVKTITNQPTSSVVWDGRNDYGEIVEAGVYIYQLKVGNSKAGKGTIVVAK